MYPACYTAPEPLEQRIAPAGLVNVTFSHGLLSISGTDGLNHDIEVIKTGANTFRVDGHGTGINSGSSFSHSYKGTLSNIQFEGDAGADVVALTNLSKLNNLRFNGGAGVDSLVTTNLKTAPGGVVAVNLGAEGGTVNFGGTITTLEGAVNFDFGGGGTVSFDALTTSVSGNATFTGGAGSDIISLISEVTTFKRALTFNGGGGDDSFASTGLALNVRGGVSMDGGAGSNNFVFAADKNFFGKRAVAGLMDIKLGDGPGAVLFLGDSTTILGDLHLDLGVGGGSAQLSSGTTTVRNGVVVTGGAGDDTVAFEGRTTIGKSLSFVGDAGADVFTASGELLSVKGATTMVGGVGNSRFDLNVDQLSLGGLTVTGDVEKDVVSIIADGSIAGDVSLLFGIDGTGISSTVLQSKTGTTNGLKFAGALTIDMVGVTVDALTIANIQVAKSFIAQTGENVSTVNIAGLNVSSSFSLKTGSGADVVNLDNVKTRNFSVDTGIGADDLSIERNAIYTGSSQILGIATIVTGDGADQIRIGKASDPANNKVMFIGAMSLDGGDGANISNNLLTSNFFVSAPLILNVPDNTAV